MRFHQKRVLSLCVSYENEVEVKPVVHLLRGQISYEVFPVPEKENRTVCSNTCVFFTALAHTCDNIHRSCTQKTVYGLCAHSFRLDHKNDGTSLASSCHFMWTPRIWWAAPALNGPFFLALLDWNNCACFVKWKFGTTSSLGHWLSEVSSWTIWSLLSPRCELLFAVCRKYL